MDASEQQTPIFYLSVSITGTKLTVDAEQLNILSSTAGDSKKCKTLLDNLQICMNQTYDEVTGILHKLLAETFGTNDIELSCTKSVSESTLFFIGGENDD